MVQTRSTADTVMNNVIRLAAAFSVGTCLCTNVQRVAVNDRTFLSGPHANACCGRSWRKPEWKRYITGDIMVIAGSPFFNLFPLCHPTIPRSSFREHQAHLRGISFFGRKGTVWRETTFHELEINLVHHPQYAIFEYNEGFTNILRFEYVSTCKVFKNRVQSFKEGYYRREVK